MKGRLFESLFGFVIILISAVFCFQVYKFSSSDSLQKPYTFLKARFSNVEGVSVGTVVKIGGVKIGKVHSLELDPDLNVVMTLAISHSVSLSEDSSVAIMSSGILGSKYVEVTPGYDDNKMQDGEFFQSTKSAINLEGIIGNFAFGKKKS